MQYAVFSVQCSVSSVQCAVFSVTCKVGMVQSSVCSVQFTVCSKQFTVCSVQCAEIVYHSPSVSGRLMEAEWKQSASICIELCSFIKCSV